jgi:hypothetical protein
MQPHANKTKQNKTTAGIPQLNATVTTIRKKKTF